MKDAAAALQGWLASAPDAGVPEAPTSPAVDASGVGLTQALAAVFGAQDRVLSRFFGPFGLTRPRWTILRVLASQPEQRLPMNEISKHMKVSTANVTKLVDGLEKGGLLRRVPSPTDRRVLFAQLTPEGEALQLELRPVIAEFLAHVWEALTAEERVLLAGLLAKAHAELERRGGGAAEPEVEGV
jgi:DNA-binding MarR family transcriptional regulator